MAGRKDDARARQVCHAIVCDFERALGQRAQAAPDHRFNKTDVGRRCCIGTNGRPAGPASNRDCPVQIGHFGVRIRSTAGCRSVERNRRGSDNCANQRIRLHPICSSCFRLIWVNAWTVNPGRFSLSIRLSFPNPGPNHTENFCRKTTTCVTSCQMRDVGNNAETVWKTGVGKIVGVIARSRGENDAWQPARMKQPF
jgi:hypothetical protein